jgi:hypothetical protein
MQALFVHKTGSSTTLKTMLDESQRVFQLQIEAIGIVLVSHPNRFGSGGDAHAVTHPQSHIRYRRHQHPDRIV